MEQTTHTLCTLVLANQASASWREVREMILPYLDHFGIPYTLVNLMKDPFPDSPGDYPLILVARGILGERDQQKLLASTQAGTGLVVFDSGFEISGEIEVNGKKNGEMRAETLEIGENSHWISSFHEPGEIIPLAGELVFQPLNVDRKSAVVTAAGQLFVSAKQIGDGRIVLWASSAWMHSRVLGPLAGMDDIFWRSLVWAARKPFVFRGLPPLVTMRVDDVAGLGQKWSQTPLYWIQMANQIGFKLGMGLFLYNLTETAVSELRHSVLNGKAVALPEALGRPPRNEETSSFYYYPGGLPMYGTDGDEFLYFHHHERRPWTKLEAHRAIDAVDAWYQAHAPLPKSCLIGPHWYEYSSSVAAHMFDHWGVEFLSTTMGVDEACNGENAWLKIGPFRKFEEPGSALPSLHQGGSRPVYYADFLEVANRQFFNCITEVRDIAGYEWRPDNNIEDTVQRGIKTLRRSLNSMALAVLFTHETDYLCKIQPQNLERELRAVSNGIEQYAPLHVTQDDGFRYVRATKTSHFRSCVFYPQSRTIQAIFSGYAEVPTSFYVFYDIDGAILSTTAGIPAFQNETNVTFTLAEVGHAAG
jgi:hypothetical protein